MKNPINDFDARKLIDLVVNDPDSAEGKGAKEILEYMKHATLRRNNRWMVILTTILASSALTQLVFGILLTKGDNIRDLPLTNFDPGHQKVNELPLTEEGLYNNAIEIHAFLESLLIGELEATRDNTRYIQESFAEDFQLISSNGKFINKGSLLDLIHEAHTTPGQSEKHPQTDIRNFKYRSLGERLYQITFLQQKEHLGITTEIIKSAILRQEKRNRIEWVNIHESFLSSDQESQ